MSNLVRILIAVPNRILRTGLCALLDQSPDVVLLGALDTIDEAVLNFAKMRPDLIVMTIAASSKESLDAIAGIKVLDPAAWIIGLAADASEENSFEARRFGAATVLSIDLINERLLPLIRAGPRVQGDDGV